jgi:hypothetical protein
MMPTGFISGTNSSETVMNEAVIDMVESMKSVKDYKLIDVVKMISQRFNLKFYSTSDGAVHLDTNENRLSGVSYHIDHLTDGGVAVEFTDNDIGIVNIKDTNHSFYEVDFNILDNNIKIKWYNIIESTESTKNKLGPQIKFNENRSCTPNSNDRKIGAITVAGRGIKNISFVSILNKSATI